MGSAPATSRFGTSDAKTSACSLSKTSPQGQALVEFALVLPILLLLIFGIIDAGRLIYTYNTVSNAARNGARVAIVNQSTAGTDDM